MQNELDLVFTVTNAAWPHLIKAGGGSVINVSSNNGTAGVGGTPQAAHAAAKAAVIGLARQLAAEGAPLVSGSMHSRQVSLKPPVGRRTIGNGQLHHS